jgi:protein gp37
MNDLFHEAVPLWFIDGVFDAAQKTPQNTYQILT